MLLHCHFVPLLIIFISIINFLSCFVSYQDYPFFNNLDQSHSSNPTAYSYSPFFGTIDDDNHKFESKSKFEGHMKYDTETIGLTRLVQVGVPSNSPKMVNVDDFGAKGDGTDDSEAFKKAWKVACSSNGGVLEVPKNRVYHLKPITFSGPCKSALTMKIYGTIKASSHPSDYEKDRRHWLLFSQIHNFVVEGGGTINGNGKIWWQNSCKINISRPCQAAPTAVTFHQCENLRVANLRIENSQQMHLSFEKCVNVKALNLNVIAPEKSPNTDGIHVSDTQNIQIRSSVIRTGDDCISIVSGSKNVQVMDITCGPGHGISIGSLGAGNSEAVVSNVLVNRVKLSRTTNGLRIKTWQGGSGYAKNIKFQNIVMDNVSNPIIIDQNYCDQTKPCPEQDSAVQVRDVVYQNIKGTSASEVAIKFDCSESFPCDGILSQDIKLVREEDGENAKASCVNVRLTSRGKVLPNCP